MRRILIDFARSCRNQKRGGDVVYLPWDEALMLVRKRELILMDFVTSETVRGYGGAQMACQ